MNLFSHGRKTHRIIAVFIIWLLCNSSLSADSGEMRGTVVDASTGRALANTTVILEELRQETTTDLRGRFVFTNVPVGTYRLLFNRTDYRFAMVSDVVVTTGRPVRMDMALEPSPVSDGEVMVLEDFVVTAEIPRDSQLGLLANRQRAATLSDAISADDFSRLGLGNAAEAMSAITGASVVDGKYVFIRGLGDRYSNTLLNGATVPSADPDRRSVQMDQFPTELLSAIVTSKSFTPDQPGSFAGGSVNIQTKSFPDYFFVNLGLGLGFNTNVMGKDVLVTEQGIGFLADGKRKRQAPEIPPTGIPAHPGRTLATASGAALAGDLSVAEELDALTRGFPLRMYPLIRSGRPGRALNVSFGNTHILGDDDSGRKFGYSFSFTHSDELRHFENGIETRTRGLDQSGLPEYADDTGFSTETAFKLNVLDFYTARYNLDADGNIDRAQPQPLDPYFNDIPFGVTQTTHSVNWGAFGKLAFLPSANHELNLTLFHNQSADDEVNRGIGYVNRLSGAGTDFLVEGISVQYTERSVNSVQLGGDHLFPEMSEARLEWQASRTTSTQDQPDYRTFFWAWDYDKGGILNPGNNMGTVDRLYRELEESRDEIFMHITVPLRNELSLKFGGLYASTHRTYRETGFNVAPFTWGQVSVDQTLSPVDRVHQQVDLVRNIYTEDYIGYDFSRLVQLPNGGFNLVDAARGRHFITQSIVLNNNSNNYDGNGDTRAAYVMFDYIPNNKWRFITGVRYEENEMIVDQFFRQSTVIDRQGGFESRDWLPAFSAVYSFDERTNLRFAYGRTIALPSFKELSPIEINNRFTGTREQGNPSLQRSVIDNLDVRWERFLPRGQLLALSVFYKSMSNPIELVVTPGVDLDGNGLDDLFRGNLVPQNVTNGEVYGIELEWRYQLGQLADWLNDFSLGGNLSYIQSSVDVPLEEQQIVDPRFVETTRQLVGQSNYLANLDLTYQNFNTGTAVTVSYNYTGERLAIVNPTKVGGLGNVFEDPMHRLNLSIRQRINHAWSVSLGAGNLLNARSQKAHENLLGGPDVVYHRSTSGRNFSISVNYTFY